MVVGYVPGAAKRSAEASGKDEEMERTKGIRFWVEKSMLKGGLR